MVGVLSVRPEFELVAFRGRPTQQSPPDAGFVMRRQTLQSVSTQTGKRELLTFEMRWLAMTEGDAYTLENLWDLNSGPCGLMTYSPLQFPGLTFEVFFDQDELGIEQYGARHYRGIVRVSEYA